MAIKPIHNETELLLKIAQGDEKAFSEIFNWYYQPLGQAINKLTESVTLTQEIVQDAFLKIWLRKETLPDIDNFSAYLFILCRNHAFKTLKQLAKERKIKLQIEQHLKWESELDELNNPSEHYRAMIKEAVDHLPTQQRKIYLLSREERMKYEEIAVQLGLSPETVKTQIYNSVKFIRKYLGSHMSAELVIILTSVLTLNA